MTPPRRATARAVEVHSDEVGQGAGVVGAPTADEIGADATAVIAAGRVVSGQRGQAFQVLKGERNER